MVFLDANIILEIVLKDRPHFNEVVELLKYIDEDTAISMLSVHLIMHFGRKEQIEDELLEKVINENEILSLAPEDYVWAVMNESDRDFEDALQLATAIRNGCDTYVTFDQALKKAYDTLPINIIAP